MKPHCLSREELSYFLQKELDSTSVEENRDMEAVLEGWLNWDIELICLVTIFSQYLERKLKNDEEVSHVVDNVSSLPDAKFGHWLALEGFGEEFVSYFLANLRNPQMTIEDDLGYLREQFGEYNY